jgi:hypothetical protein
MPPAQEKVQSCLQNCYCISRWRPDKVVSNATSAVKCLLLDRKLKNDSNCSMGVGCILRRRPDPLVSNAKKDYKCLHFKRKFKTASKTFFVFLD